MSTTYIGTQLETTLEIEKIVSFHYFEYVKNFEGQSEWHDFWEVLYVDSGEVIALADNEKHILRQGDCIFHKPNEEHNVIVKDNFARTFIFSFVSQSTILSFLDKKIFHLNTQERELVAEFFQEGKNAFCPPYNVLNQAMLNKREDSLLGAEQLTKINLEKILILLIRKTQSHEKQSRAMGNMSQPSDEIINFVTRFLDKNIQNKITLDSIVTYTSFSKSYLEKIFHDEFNCGVMQYFLILRINYSKRLISENNYTISEIAELLNFNSIHHFSRTFKKITGSTPSQFKNSLKIRYVL